MCVVGGSRRRSFPGEQLRFYLSDEIIRKERKNCAISDTGLLYADDSSAEFFQRFPGLAGHFTNLSKSFEQEKKKTSFIFLVTIFFLCKRH